jgi:hypothetical protein
MFQRTSSDDGSLPLDTARIEVHVGIDGTIVSVRLHIAERAVR